MPQVGMLALTLLRVQGCLWCRSTGVEEEARVPDSFLLADGLFFGRSEGELPHRGGRLSLQQAPFEVLQIWCVLPRCFACVIQATCFGV